MLRRIFTITLLAAVLAVACAPAATPIPVEPTEISVEPALEPVELSMWSEWCVGVPPGDCKLWNDTYCDGTIKQPGDLGRRYVQEWHKLHPEYSHIDIKCIQATSPGGQIGQELLAMVRAGQGPNIYALFGGRAWLGHDIGIDLDKYITQEAKDDFIDYDVYREDDGSVRLLAGLSKMEYPLANKQLIERACAQEGFDCIPPEPWTVVSRDNYYEIAEAVKALDDGSYVGVLWGSEPSGQQQCWAYFAQVGLAAYEDGEFTGFVGGEAMLTELLRLYDEGYLYPDIAGLAQGDANDLWAQGKIAFPIHRFSSSPKIDAAVAAGQCEPWDLIPLLGIQFEEGVRPLPLGNHANMAGFVADNTPEEYREAATSFMIYVLSQPNKGVGSFPDYPSAMHSQKERKLLVPGTRDEILAYIDEYGLANNGTTTEIFNRVREAHAQMLTAVFLHELTPEEGLAQFQATIAELQGE